MIALLGPNSPISWRRLGVVVLATFLLTEGQISRAEWTGVACLFIACETAVRVVLARGRPAEPVPTAPNIPPEVPMS